MIDMASVYAERYKQNPQALQAAVMGQSPDPKLDPYTALNALRLVKESQMMAMGRQAQQPTSAPSILAETMAPQRGLAAMMPMGAPAGQMAAPAPQAPVMQASGGLAGLPTTDEEYAAGGIVAFAEPTDANNNALVQDPEAPAVTAAPNFDPTETETDTDTEVDTGQGNAGLQSLAFGELQKSINRMRAIERREPTKAEKAAMFKDIVSQLEDVGGPDIYKDVNASLDARKVAMEKGLGQDQGLALLHAAGAILKGRTLSEGASNALPAFATHMAEANKNQQAEQRAIESARFNVNDAQRKERMGNRRAAMAAMDSARKDNQAADTFALNKEKAISSALATTIRATRPGSAAGANASIPAVDKQLAAARIALAEDPENAALQRRVKALEQTLTLAKTAQWSPEKAASEEVKATGKTDTELDKQVAKDRIFDPAWQNATTAEEKDAAETALRNRLIARRSQGKPAGGGVNKNSTTAPNISTIKGAPEGATIGKQTAKGWEVLDSSGKLIGYAK